MDTSCKSELAVRETAEPLPRRIRTLQEKLQILSEASQPGASVAAVARRHEINANLLFAWRRLHRRGSLEQQRHAPAPPLLPVTITAPTVTPTQRVTREHATVPASRATVPRLAGSSIEIVLPGDVRIHLHGDAQRAVLTRVLEWLPRR